jgi:hypothetical protein
MQNMHGSSAYDTGMTSGDRNVSVATALYTGPTQSARSTQTDALNCDKAAEALVCVSWQPAIDVVQQRAAQPRYASDMMLATQEHA